jgi:hypothetical protein
VWYRTAPPTVRSPTVAVDCSTSPSSPRTAPPPNGSRAAHTAGAPTAYAPTRYWCGTELYRPRARRERLPRRAHSRRVRPATPQLGDPISSPSSSLRFAPARYWCGTELRRPRARRERLPRHAHSRRRPAAAFVVVVVIAPTRYWCGTELRRPPTVRSPTVAVDCSTSASSPRTSPSSPRTAPAPHAQPARPAQLGDPIATARYWCGTELHRPLSARPLSAPTVAVDVAELATNRAQPARPIPATPPPAQRPRTPKTGPGRYRTSTVSKWYRTNTTPMRHHTDTTLVSYRCGT